MKGWIVLLLVGCAPVLGIEDLPREQDASVPDAGPKPIEYVSTECGPCIASSCQEQTKACEAIPACRAMAACLAGCAPNNIKCRSECEGADPDTDISAPLRALDDCRRGRCVRECIGFGGAATLLGEGCACVDTKCASDMSKCIQNGGCERYAQCLARRGYNPASCMFCRTRDPEGYLASLPLGTCILTAACTECTLVGGNNYDCAGKYIWEKPPSATSLFHVRVYEQGSSSSLPSGHVTACLPERCAACDDSAPGAISADVQPGGYAELMLKTPFYGCFHVTGSPEHVDILEFLGRPVLRPESTWGFALFVKNNVKAFLDILGIKPIKDRGHLAALTVDCVMNPSAGIHVEISPKLPETQIAYFVGAFPRTDVTETDPSGQVAIVNAPTGFVTITTSRGGKPVGQQKAYVRPDPSDTELTTITGLIVMPSETPL